MLTWNVKTQMKDIDTIIHRLGLEEDGEATKFLRDEIDRLSDAYIPMNSGILKDTKIYPSNHEITYVSPYAHYMYKGKLMLAKNGSSWAKFGEEKHYTNKSLKYQGAPKRGAEWDKRMVGYKGKEIERNLRKFIRNGGK